MREQIQIALKVDGRECRLVVEPRKLLADVLRDDLELTGVRVSCELGVCGACTVLVDGRTARACLMLAVQANGSEVLTVQGLGSPDVLHPIQQAFWDHHGLQCGFCTPGMLLTAYELLQHNPSPSEAQVREGIAGNICRCTGYVHIVKAILAAAEALQQGAIR